MGNDTYVFEARVKANNSKGVDVFVKLASSEAGISFVYNSTKQDLTCGNGEQGCGQTMKSCNTNLTKYRVLKFEANSGGVKYFVDGNLKQNLSSCVPTTKPMKIHLTCQGTDGQPKNCQFDYVRLTKK